MGALCAGRTKRIFYLLSFPDVLNANGSRSYYSPLKAGSPAPLHNPLLMAHTHTLLWSSFQVCGGYLCIFQCRCIFFFLSSGRSSYFRMVFCSFHFLPIFSCWRRSCRERTSVMNPAPAGSCDPTRRGRTPLGRRNHRPRGPNHHGGVVATKVAYFGVKSAKVLPGADGHQTC